MYLFIYFCLVSCLQRLAGQQPETRHNPPHTAVFYQTPLPELCHSDLQRCKIIRVHCRVNEHTHTHTHSRVQRS